MISMSKEIENNSLKAPQENNNPESNVVNQMNNPELNHGKNDLSLKDNSRNNDLEIPKNSGLNIEIKNINEMNVNKNNEPQSVEIKINQNNNTEDVNRIKSTMENLKKEDKNDIRKDNETNNIPYRRKNSCRCCNNCGDICKALIELLLKSILLIIDISMSIIMIFLLVRIHTWTKENPLEIYDNDNINNQPTNTPIINLKKDDNRIKGCKCGDKIMKTICKEEQIVSGCEDISLNLKQYFLRHLDDNCKDFEEQIKKNNGEIHKAFDLKFKKVHSMSLGILVLYCIIFGVMILTFLATLAVLCCEDCAKAILIPLAVILIIISSFSGIVNLILFIIMMVNYYKGYSTGDFLDYYDDCMDNNNRNEFNHIYKKLDRLNKYFTSFVCLNFISMLFSCGSSFLRKKNND